MSVPTSSRHSSIWDLASGKRLARFNRGDEDGDYVRVAFHADGEGIDIMNTNGARFRGRIADGLGGIGEGPIPPNPFTLKEAPADAVIPALPEEEPGSKRGSLEPTNRITTPDGRWELAGCKEGVELIEVATKRRCFILPTQDRDICCVALSPDGRWAGSISGRVHMWATSVPDEFEQHRPGGP